MQPPLKLFIGVTIVSGIILTIVVATHSEPQPRQRIVAVSPKAASMATAWRHPKTVPTQDVARMVTIPPVKPPGTLLIAATPVKQVTKLLRPKMSNKTEQRLLPVAVTAVKTLALETAPQRETSPEAVPQLQHKREEIAATAPPPENVEVAAPKPHTEMPAAAAETAADRGAAVNQGVPLVLTNNQSPKPITAFQGIMTPKTTRPTQVEIPRNVTGENVLDRLKLATDFQSVGVGYQVFEMEKSAVDVMAYTDKAGVGLSYKLNDQFHLGVSDTVKYGSGEQQIRVYVSVPLGPQK